MSKLIEDKYNAGKAECNACFQQPPLRPCRGTLGCGQLLGSPIRGAVSEAD